MVDHGRLVCGISFIIRLTSPASRLSRLCFSRLSWSLACEDRAWCLKYSTIRIDSGSLVLQFPAVVIALVALLADVAASGRVVFVDWKALETITDGLTSEGLVAFFCYLELGVFWGTPRHCPI